LQQSYVDPTNISGIIHSQFHLKVLSLKIL